MILVTGATGFLGSELVMQLLEKGYSVRALKRESSLIPAILKDKAEIEWVNADILNYFSLEEAFSGIRQVYHCAAFISFYSEDKKKLRKINVEGTANIVNLCLDKKIDKLVHVSSVAAVGEAKPGKLITEKNQWEFSNKQHGYSISKHESEMEVWRGIAEGLDAVIVNPSVIIGKNAGTAGSGQLFETVKKGLKFYTSGSFGLVNVEDVAKAMILLMESDISAERYLVNAENWTYKTFFTEVANSYGIKPPSFLAKPWVLGIGWRVAKLASLFTGIKPGLTETTARNAFKEHAYSNAKIKQAIGFEFKSIKETIREICKQQKEYAREQKLLHN